MKISRNVVLGLAAISIISSCSSAGEQKEKSQVAVNVEAYYPTQSTNEGFYLSGEITARQTASISTRMMGYINKIYVKPGNKVSAGQQLVSISSDEIQAKKAQIQAMITEAEAAAKNAERDYERFKTLHAQNSVSDKELENVALQHTSMQAKVQMAHQQMNEVNALLTYTNIRAPFSGTITQKLMDEGSMANPGMPILMMEQSGELQIIASVPESYIPYVKVGDMAQIEVKSLGTTIPGKVSELSPSAYRTGGQYAMKLAIDTKDKENIHSGMYVNILIPNKVKEDIASRIMIDKNSLVYRDQLTGVYVVDDRNQANLRWVRLGKIAGNQIEVLSGLNQNDKVVLSAESKLYNGVKVSISK
ncbi:RND family efflux transporter MFP subunit [Parabacteroides sp. PF5-5]|uniref:efflux RND transporter periplasmic adaptor subunit n=1 Tax=unclassified Parabacteroides TaxID=2649774 RepID=UPI002475F2FE|nr:MULTISPECIES: efflux RND transporter periplasmic adaptor subunit [unclassified Parabacteroides]MDH6303704.1 RND family efflux transporter MFP subunit [Parabacteroides sp. PH5-39]MDH6314321.1 RND family efflux transporter MFP subunit [Parabacteroides sp. PF5-13]MDH6318615.1 RND family efflux transporter MFP subunit [Parabacteroides sp. PH5-13]MDH6322093.1 RND family efflux transporter MFP subunit [Parabacteroides sp. PH5-8]MDH6325828.1 RND family efflux transporter MFP subunit [Parabacteroid